MRKSLLRGIVVLMAWWTLSSPARSDVATIGALGELELLILLEKVW